MAVLSVPKSHEEIIKRACAQRARYAIRRDRRQAAGRTKPGLAGQLERQAVRAYHGADK